MDFEAIGDRFDNNAGAGSVVQNPVKLGGREFGAEGETA